jgi:ferritin-like metal-binding protein YciE
MTATLSNPRDLFLALLAEALWIEHTLVHDVLPTLEREADSEWLAKPLGDHLETTRSHAARVEAAFLAVGAEPVSAASDALEGLRRAHDERVSSLNEPRLKDLFLVDAAARTEHLELALYESLAALAPPLGVDPGPLLANRDEERQALEELERVRGRLLAALAS